MRISDDSDDNYGNYVFMQKHSHLEKNVLI